MIWTRTQNDIDTAKNLITKKVQKFIPLTDADVEALERGTLTINTLNRIELKQEELKNLFEELGYYNTPIVNKVWDYTHILNEADFSRIVENTAILKDAFFVLADTPVIPPISYYYENINSLEKILHDLDVMINNVKSNYRECGTFECGEAM